MEVELTPDDIAAQTKILAKKPRVAEVRALPGARYEETPDGKYTVNVDLRKRGAREELKALRKPYVEAASEHQAAVAARTPTVSVVTPDGEHREIPERAERVAAAKGFHYRPRWRGRRYDGEDYDPTAKVRWLRERDAGAG